MSTTDKRKQILAELLKIDLSQIKEEAENIYSVEGPERDIALTGTYLVLTEDEADNGLDQYFDKYLENYGLAGVSEHMLYYFDREEWERDTTRDCRERRGHCIYRVNKKW